MGDAQEAIHLNRLLRLFPPGAEGGERWELEPTLDTLRFCLTDGLGDESKAVSTPGVRMIDEGRWHGA